MGWSGGVMGKKKFLKKPFSFQVPSLHYSNTPVSGSPYGGRSTVAFSSQAKSF
jgi:hypothetical protein